MKKCPICHREMRESRMGAPCYVCVPSSTATTSTTPRWGDDAPPLTMDTLRDAMKLIPAAPPRVEFRVMTADEQHRTPRDVPVMWTRPKVPSKRNGRRGTRRAWKRAHPPHMLFAYREPNDILMVTGSALTLSFGRVHASGPDIMIVTPAQMALIEAKTQQRQQSTYERSFYSTLYGQPYAGAKS